MNDFERDVVTVDLKKLMQMDAHVGFPLLDIYGGESHQDPYVTSCKK